MKKKILLTFLVLASFFLTSSTLVLAQDLSAESEGKEVVAIVLATVDIYDAKIVNQTKNNLEISFNIKNEEGIQPDVKYAVQLTDNSGKVFDSKLFNEKITIGNDETINRIVNYQAPDYISGDFEIWVISRNSQGLILGKQKAGEINLEKGRDGFVYIDEDSCQLVVQEDSNENTYKLNRKVYLKKGSNLFLDCEIGSKEKNSVSDVDLFPLFRVYQESVFSDQLLKEERGPAIRIDSSENKKNRLMVPVLEDAYNYEASLFLVNNLGEKISNEIVVHYTVKGLKATIKNLKLDKNRYEKGDIADISFIWTGSSDGYDDIELIFSIINKDDAKNEECADMVVKTIKDILKTEGGKIDLKMPIIKNCSSPLFSASIKSNDNILAKSEVLIANPKESSLNLKLIILGILVIVVLSIFLIFRKKIFRVIPFFIFFVSCFLFLNNNIAEALTFSVGSVGDDVAIYNVSITQTHYSTYDLVYAHGTAEQLAVCDGSGYTRARLAGEQTTATSESFWDQIIDYVSVSGSTAPVSGSTSWAVSESGRIYFRGYNCNGDYAGTSLPYTSGPFYMCTGTISSATLCTGDSTGLTANTAKSVVDTCGNPKCEYTCNSGYVKSESTCVPLTCTGTPPPTGSTLCSGDDTGLTAATAWANVGTSSTSCTSARKCEYYITPPLACTGTPPPTGSTLCSGDDIGLTAATAWANVGTSSSSCTSARKCEYYTAPTAVNGVCGSGNNTYFFLDYNDLSSVDKLCSSGIYTNYYENINTNTPPTWSNATWTCAGQNGGSSQSCQSYLYSCTGDTTPGLATNTPGLGMCNNDWHHLTEPLPWVNVGPNGLSCTEGRKCEYFYSPIGCTPTNSACATNTCIGQTCWDGCANIPGTKSCTTPPPTCACQDSTYCGGPGSAPHPSIPSYCLNTPTAGWMVSGCQWVTCGSTPTPPPTIPAPTLNFSANPITINLGETTRLTWTVSGNATSCSAFGDSDWTGAKSYTNGTYDQDIIPSTIGNKTYSLVCSNTGGSSGIKTATVTVNAIANIPPTATITYPTGNQIIDIESTIHFTGTGTDSDGTINRYRWWLNSCDGTRLKVGPDATFLDYQFNEIGTFNIFFQVRDDDNAWSTCDSRTITVNSISTPTPTPTPIPVCTGATPSLNMKLCDEENGASELTADTPNSFVFSCPTPSANKCRYTCKGL